MAKKPQPLADETNAAPAAVLSPLGVVTEVVNKEPKTIALDNGVTRMDY